MATFDLYQTVTDKIIAMMETGTVPWRSPILTRDIGWPVNYASKKQYRGCNVFLLAFTGFAHGYDSAYWLTFKQAQSAGGAVRKGERSTQVIFWTMLEGKTPDPKNPGKNKKIPVLRYYNVFNLCQIDGIAKPDAQPAPVPFDPIAAAQAIVDGYTPGPKLVHEGNRACYRPTTDTVTIPAPTSFTTNHAYYATLFHELSHSTGHESRLKRLDNTCLAPFGSPDYSREELVAEMSSAFLCAHAGITPALIENQTAYIANWTKALKSDKRAVITAAGAAQKSADWIMGTRNPVDAPPETTCAPDPE